MKNLTAIREKHGISKYALSKSLGISDVAVLRLEQGKSNPSVELLKKIADYFGVSTDYLLDREEFRISQSDQDFLNRFSNLTNTQQKAILKIIESFEKINASRK